jgi:hypothetical protein
MVRAGDVGIARVGQAEGLTADGDSPSAVLGVGGFSVDEIDVLDELKLESTELKEQLIQLLCSSLSWRPRVRCRCESRRSDG